MIWAPETDKRPKIVAPGLIGQRYDAALDGMGIILDWEGTGGFMGSFGSTDAVGYAQESDEIGIEQTSTSDDIAENKLTSNEFWRSMRDWQGGLGQNRFDVPKVSLPNAYRSSYQVDTRIPGQLSLRRSASAVTISGVDYSGGVPASEVASNGVWMTRISSGASVGVTLYNLSTFTNKALGVSTAIHDLTVAPDDTCYIATDTQGIYKVTSGTAASQWCTQICWRICAAKARLFAVSGPSAGLSAFYEIPTEGTAPVTAVKKLDLPPNSLCADIKEAGGLILFAVSPLNLTSTDPIGAPAIYAYDGTNAPYRALVFTKGEECNAIHVAYGGAIVLLFCRRMDSDGTVRSIIYQTSVANGQLTPAQLIFEYPRDHTSGIVFEVTQTGAHAYFCSSQDDTNGTGFGIDSFNLNEGTVSHDAMPPTILSGTTPRTVAQYKGRLLWIEYDGSAFKLYVEDASSYVTSGYLISSVIDLNVDAPKQWTALEAACLPLQAGEKIQVYWTADKPEAQDWRLALTLNPWQTTNQVPLNVTSRQISLKVVLTGPGTSTPTLTKLGVAAQMARAPQLNHLVKQLAVAHMERLDGQQHEDADERYFYRMSALLEGLRVTSRPVWWQSPLSRYDGHVEKVKIGQVAKRLLNNPAKVAGGTIAYRLHNVEPDRRNLLPLGVAALGSVPVILSPASVFETIGGAAAPTRDTANDSWVNGTAGVFTKCNSSAVGHGIRGPAPHFQVPWDPLDRRGQSVEAYVLVRPYVDSMKFTLVVEAWNAADAVVQTDTSTVLTLGTGTAGSWFLLPLEGVNYDGLSVPVWLTITVKLASGSATGAFGWDGAQLEQANICTPFIAPPSTF